MTPLTAREPLVAILDAGETIYFEHPDGCGPLRQRFRVTVANTTTEVLSASAAISAEGEDVVTPLLLQPGTHTYHCYAPVLWPRPAEPAAKLTLRTGSTAAECSVTVGRHRPWTLFLLADTCVDYTWAYDELARQVADSVATTRSEIEACRETAGAAWADENRHNLIHSVELGFFLEHATADEERELAELVRQGRMSLSIYHNMMLTANVSLPEAARQFYPAARFARKWGLALPCANHQETPTISWSQASVLAAAGVRHLVKSILAYDTPWNDRLQEPPIFVWEGPDGARVLVRRRNTDYFEGRFVLDGVEATVAAVEAKVAEYEALGDAYPFNVAGLVGCYSDLSPHTPDLAKAKAATIAAYNSSGWEYPRLVNASHDAFWEEIEAEIEALSPSLPVSRGDYGASWEVWPISLANSFAGWRRAQELAAQADTLAALRAWAEPSALPALEPHLKRGWRNLLLLSDHAWNGSSDASRALNAALRREWQKEAKAAFSEATAAALSPASDGDREVTVVNTVGWQRHGLASLEGRDLPPGPLLALCGDGGQGAPVEESDGEGEGRRLSFVARDVPPLASQRYTLRPAGQAWRQVTDDGRIIENDFYRVEVGGQSGAIVSLWDKRRSRELADAARGGLNRAHYHDGGSEAALPLTWLVRRTLGPASQTLAVTARGDGIEIRTRITVRDGLDSVAIENRVHKTPQDHPELLSFAFPFQVPGGRYRVEGPGVIYAPGDLERGGEQLPGSGQGVHALRHCVGLCGDDVGVWLVPLDSGIIRFGTVSPEEAPCEPGPDATVYSLALGSLYNYREVCHDQGGDTDFVFRFLTRANDGGFDPVAMVRFGAEAASGLVAVAGAAQRLPALRALPGQLVLAELKVADEGIAHGLLARLWNPTERAITASLQMLDGALVGGAWLTDMVERDRERLAVRSGKVQVSVPARGYASVRLLPAGTPEGDAGRA